MTRGTTNGTRAHLASISNQGPITTWNPGADGDLGVWALVFSPTRLFAGGDFLNVGGQARPGFARFSGTP